MMGHGRFAGEYVAACADGRCNYISKAQTGHYGTKLTVFSKLLWSACMDVKEHAFEVIRFEESDSHVAIDLVLT
jgi:hypothetical protein